MRAMRDTMVLSPPLIIQPDEIELILRKARLALDHTARDLDLI